MTSGAKRGESKHDINFFLDPEIQEKLLEVDWPEDESAEKDVSPTDKKFRYLSKSSELEYSDFSQWLPKGSPSNSQKVELKNTSKATPYKEPPWRAYTDRHRNFEFQHYKDIRKYIEQYRMEHTYQVPYDRTETIVDFSKGGGSSAALSKELFRNSEHNHENGPAIKELILDPTGQGTCLCNRLPSNDNFNLLHLASRYKLSPGFSPHKLENNSNDSENFQKSRESSGNETLRSRSSKTVNLTPTGKLPATIFKGRPIVISNTANGVLVETKLLSDNKK